MECKLTCLLSFNNSFFDELCRNVFLNCNSYTEFFFQQTLNCYQISLLRAITTIDTNIAYISRLLDEFFNGWFRNSTSPLLNMWLRSCFDTTVLTTLLTSLVVPRSTAFFIDKWKCLRLNMTDACQRNNLWHVVELSHLQRRLAY